MVVLAGIAALAETGRAPALWSALMVPVSRLLKEPEGTLRDGPSALLRVRQLLRALILRSERSERLEGWAAKHRLFQQPVRPREQRRIPC
jgi:hypothetical protein